MKKILSLVLVLAMALCLFAGCASEESNTSDKLTMATNAEFPPFEYLENGEIVGADVEIAQAIAKKLGKELEITNIDFDAALTGAATGKYDMAVAGMTITEERKQKVDFSDPYYVATQVMIVGADNEDIKTAEDLKTGKKVGVVLGYTGDGIVTEDLQIAEENIVRANRGVDVVQDVKNGKLDAVVMDSATGKALADKNGLKVVEDAEAFATEEYAIAVKKGNTELLDSINAVLAEMEANGEI